MDNNIQEWLRQNCLLKQSRISPDRRLWQRILKVLLIFYNTISYQ